MDQGEKEQIKKSVFDGFIVLSKNCNLMLKWPNATLNPAQLRTLQILLSRLNYLGRSESWVEASVVKDNGSQFMEKIDWNCFPMKSLEDNDRERPGNNNMESPGNKDWECPHDNNREKLEPVDVACVIPPAVYDQNPFLPPSGKGKKGKKPSNPLSWLEALCLTSDDVLNMTLSHHPGMKTVTYLRPRDCFDIKYRPRRREGRSVIDAVLYALESKVPRKITDTILVSQRFREILMGINKKEEGKENLSPRFSGKGEDGEPNRGHSHAYFLPMDLEGKGYIDHLLVISREPFNFKELSYLDKMEKLWWFDDKSYPIRLTPIMFTRDEYLPKEHMSIKPALHYHSLPADDPEEEHPPVRPAFRYRSATPFIPARHWRKGRGNLFDWLRDEIRKEAQNHGLPSPVKVEWVGVDLSEPGKFKCEKSSLEFDWHQFRRNRKGDRPRWGYNLSLTFTEPPPFPVFSLGYASHFGMGLFMPVKE